VNKILSAVAIVALIAAVAWIAHVLRSDGTTGDLDLSKSATPSVTPTPEATPIDPAEIVQVDTSVEGTVLTVNGDVPKPTVNCTKYDRVYVNASGQTATIKGSCRQIMINGDKDQITADAASEFVFNGSGSTVTYTRFVNGKVPTVVDNTAGNDVQKAPFAPTQKDQTKQKAK
jgi:hypothetical protein